MPLKNVPNQGKPPGKKVTIVKRETAKHREAFWVWYDHTRHFDKTQKELGVSADTLASWIQSFKWHTRADELDKKAYDKAVEKVAERNANRAAKMVEEHFKYGANLIGFGGAYLSEQVTVVDADGNKTTKTRGVDNGAQAIQAIKLGVDVQRLAEGLATERGELTGKDGAPVAFTLEDWKKDAAAKIEAVTRQVNARIPKPTKNGKKQKKK